MLYLNRFESFYVYFYWASLLRGLLISPEMKYLPFKSLEVATYLGRPTVKFTRWILAQRFIWFQLPTFELNVIQFEIRLKHFSKLNTWCIHRSNTFIVECTNPWGQLQQTFSKTGKWPTTLQSTNNFITFPNFNSLYRITFSSRSLRTFCLILTDSRFAVVSPGDDTNSLHQESSLQYNSLERLNWFCLGSSMYHTFTSWNE